jgi:hypothetical protein
MATQCCTLSCLDGACSDEVLCAMEAEACIEDSDCCADSCEGGFCAPASSSCAPLGEACAGDSACCSGSCEDVDGTLRCTLASLCRAGGELCDEDADCCSGVCGDDGLCPVMEECQTAGEPCTGFHECCSGICADPGTGVEVCTYVSGCRPIGEICVDDAGCCSGSCEPYEDAGVSRCEHQTTPGCLMPGEVCWEGMAANCCPPGPSGGSDLCLPTVLEIRRCFSDDAVDECFPDSVACSFADECCSGYCLPDEVGSLDLFCASECVALGGACTTDGDCCSPDVCVAGVCSPAYADCLPLASECVNDDECCSGYCDLTGGICLSPYL